MSGIEEGLRDIANAIYDSSTAEIPKEVVQNLFLVAGQALVVLAADYRAYFNLTAYSGSQVEVVANASAILKIYGNFNLDNDAVFNMHNEGILNRKGE